MRMTLLDRTLLLLTGLLAAYQVVVGIEGLGALAAVSYTAAFGVLLLAGLLMIIMGFEILESRIVIIVATIVPLTLSLGLIAQYLPGLQVIYGIFAVMGLIAIILTRLIPTPGKLATITLAVVHGVAGLLIAGLPVVLSLQGVTLPGFALVGVGGVLIGLGGLLLAFLRIGHPILSQAAIYRSLPGLLLAMTAAFVTGMALA